MTKIQRHKRTQVHHESEHKFIYDPNKVTNWYPIAVHNFNWIAAIDAWDYCDPALLSEMIAEHNIPEELKPIVSDIISGRRQQNKKAASKLKIDPKERLYIALYTIDIRSIIEQLMSKNTVPDYFEIANNMRKEPIELLNSYRKNLIEFDKDTAENAGISVSSLKNLVKDLKTKLHNYPEI
ncbi:hypothetical protein [Thalassotalea sp. PP2-459]|uniref:hypothetical protein n=1 Tax=Thalassotalea sp. PP2-459 TaxID=1742724 RepID=UPI0009433DD2|nr:hypothetical protein [Thalassotalea sp. PP2-459]OKY27659.1 hypothetical protein BI291_07895 [Thalassotalea sp. PP2-459]